MLQSRGELHLTTEPIGVHGSRHVRRQHFQHHSPPKHKLLSHENATHATAAKLPLDTIAVAQLGPEVG